jgi:hypothetical protein
MFFSLIHTDCYCARFEDLTVVMKIQIFWVVTDISEELAVLMSGSSQCKARFLDCVDPEDGGGRLLRNVSNLYQST